MSEGFNKKWQPPKPAGDLGNLNENDKVVNTGVGELTLSASEASEDGVNLEAGEYHLEVNRETGEAIVFDSHGNKVAKFDPETGKTTKI